LIVARSEIVKRASGILYGLAYLALIAGHAPAVAQSAARAVPVAAVPVAKVIVIAAEPQGAPNVEQPNGVWHAPDLGQLVGLAYSA
jgi:hypothetical protein